VGLLFGFYSSDGIGSGRDVSIVDAEEMIHPKMEPSSGEGEGEGEGDHETQRAAILKKIELHQKCFPHHKVVGWYRVQGDDENSMNVEAAAAADNGPSEQDLRMNQTEMARYCGSGDNTNNNEEEGGGGEDGDGESPLFLLMNLSKTNDGGDKKPSSTSSSSATNASEEMEIDEELPLTMYETLTTPETGGGAVFVNVDFELETYEPERIAVEKVFKTQPSKSAVPSAATATKDVAPASSKEDAGNTNRKTGKKSKKDESEQQKQQRASKPSFTRGPTELDGQLDSLQSSIRAMNVRMNVLLEFLQRVERGEITADDTLLRSVDGLIRQLPLVLAALEEGQAGSSAVGAGRKPLCELEQEHGNTMLLTYLAAVAKTAKSVHVYSEKFRNVCESGKSDPRRPLY